MWIQQFLPCSSEINLSEENIIQYPTIVWEWEGRFNPFREPGTQFTLLVGQLLATMFLEKLGL
jgi:hypothetical protein